MEILINGQKAYLKKNTSFDFISENSMFTGSDSYTLTITFPLKDCPQNIAIFGHIHRKDIVKTKVIFDCEIRDRSFVKTGSITITQITDTEVKTQFLEGRSEQNFNSTFDNIFLNELNLGYPNASDRSSRYVGAEDTWWDCYPGCDWVALPWVNNTSGNLQNAVVKDSWDVFEWASESEFEITYQPYLLYILHKICSVLGYQGFFNSIENSKFQYLLICNTLPNTWGAWNFAIALPHWTLTEFFEQLELLMGGEFNIDHKAKTITFEFSHIIAKNIPPIYINKVVNKYSVDVSRENKSEYKGITNLTYADNDNRMWAYRNCQWYIDQHKKEAMVFDKLDTLLNHVKSLKTCGVESHSFGSNGRGRRSLYSRGYPSGSDGHKLFYAKDVDTYFIMWCYKAEFVDSFHMSSTDTDYRYYRYTNRLMPINQFGRLVVNKDSEDVELHIVPAWIDYTDDNLGHCIFLECGEMDSADTWTIERDEQGYTTGSNNKPGNYRSLPDEEDAPDYNNGALAQSRAGMLIAKGEQEKGDAYFDKIYVAFWDGEDRHQGKMPCPTVDALEITDDFRAVRSPYSLRINKTGIKVNGQSSKYTYLIDSRKKFNISFLSNEIPDPRGVFYIDGGKYVCEKITATFHEETGKSQLLKGVFYLIIE